MPATPQVEHLRQLSLALYYSGMNTCVKARSVWQPAALPSVSCSGCCCMPQAIYKGQGKNLSCFCPWHLLCHTGKGNVAVVPQEQQGDVAVVTQQQHSNIAVVTQQQKGNIVIVTQQQQGNIAVVTQQ